MQFNFTLVIVNSSVVLHDLIPVKRSTKSYFTHYSCVVIVFFNTALCRSAYSTISLRKLVFRLSVLSLNQDINMCVIMLCNFDGTRKIAPWKIAPRMTAPQQIPPWKITTWKTAP